MDLLGTLAALWRRKWLVLGLTVITLAVSLVLSSLKSAVYVSTTTVWVKPTALNPLGSIPLSASIDLPTEAALVGSQQVAQIAARTLGQPVGDVLGHASASYPAAGNLLYVSYSSSTPAAAQRGADAFANAYLEFRKQDAMASLNAAIQNASTQISSLRTGDTGTPAEVASQITIWQSAAASLDFQSIDPGEIINPAGLPGSPAGAGHKQDAFRGLLLGLLIGVAAALFQEKVLGRAG